MVRVWRNQIPDSSEDKKRQDAFRFVISTGIEIEELPNWSTPGIRLGLGSSSNTASIKAI